jgi:indole-3-pyruvate monooxygenase
VVAKRPEGEVLTERVVDTLIVGAGPAGLGAAASLRHAALAFEVVERADTIASTWRSHYDRLHLHTVRDRSVLPYMRWPRTAPRYPSRADFIAYAESYAQQLAIEPRFATTLTRAHRDGDAWISETTNGTWRSKNLIVATGYNGVARVPEWPGRREFRGTVMHSSEYRNGSAWKGKRALVVGSGNSGGELAVDLVEHGAEVGWVVRGPVWVAPIEKWGVANQENSILLSKLPLWLGDAIARFVLWLTVGDLSRYGFVRPAAGPLETIWTQGRVPILDVGTIDLVKKGVIRVQPAVERFTPTGVAFADGTEQPFDLVVLATGFEPRLDRFLEPWRVVCDERGRPRRHGTEAEIPGLYFVGFRNPPTGALREIGIEGPRVAREIAARVP